MITSLLHVFLGGHNMRELTNLSFSSKLHRFFIVYIATVINMPILCRKWYLMRIPLIRNQPGELLLQQILPKHL